MMDFIGWAGKRLGWLALVVVGALGPGLAQAAIYNIVLKAPGSTTPVTCATGAFTFTKTVSGTFSVSGVQVNVTGNCIVQTGNYNGTLSVIVENVTVNGQDQGPNVVGLSGTLTRPQGNSQSALTFAYTAGSASTPTPVRPLTLVASNGGSTASTYYLFNQAQAVPEPGALWLVFAGLAVLLLSRRARARI